MSELNIFQQSYEINPITLVQGIAANFPGGTQPITDLTQPNGTGGLTYDDFSAKWKPVPGATLAEWQIAAYPFANMVVAANAVIQMPLKVSMMLILPSQNDPENNYSTKLNLFTSIQTQIQKHISLGGYFTVNTPAFIYTGMLLRTIRDVTPAGSTQPQIIWQWDFEQPLISLQNSAQSLGNVMGHVENGTPTQTSWNAPGTTNL